MKFKGVYIKYTYIHKIYINLFFQFQFRHIVVEGVSGSDHSHPVDGLGEHGRGIGRAAGRAYHRVMILQVVADDLAGQAVEELPLELCLDFIEAVQHLTSSI